MGLEITAKAQDYIIIKWQSQLSSSLFEPWSVKLWQRLGLQAELKLIPSHPYSLSLSHLHSTHRSPNAFWMVEKGKSF